MARFFRSIQGKILFSILCTVMIIAVVAMAVVFDRTSKIMKEEAVNFMSTNMYSVNLRWLELSDALTSLVLKISTNSKITEFMQMDVKEASYDEFQVSKEIEGRLGNYLVNEKFVDNILIVMEDGSNFSTLSHITPLEEGLMYWDFCSEGGFMTLKELDGELLFFRPFITNDGVIGYSILFLNRNSFENILMSYNVKDTVLFSVTRSGVHLAGDELGKDELDEAVELIGNVGSRGDILEYDGDKYFVLHSSLDICGGIETVGVVPYRSMISDISQIGYTVLAVLLISVVMTVGISWFLSNLVVRNINSLKISMLRIMEGDIKERAELPKEEELRELTLIFNRMMDRIDDLMKVNTEKELEKQMMRQNYLQMQIRPHFIYNIINTIKFVAHRHGYTDIENIAVAVVELLRAVIGKNSESVSLSQEIEYCRDYVLLQNFRLEGDFRLVSDIPEDLMDFTIPILSLQPIVENAILHGYENMSGGTITVKCRLEDGSLRLTVRDEGKGFSTGGTDGLSFSGVGVRNVFERMKLSYGSGFSGNITSAEGEGTTVEFILPYVQSSDR